VPANGAFPVQPPPAEKPGFIYEFGRWWDTTRGKFEELGKQSDAAAKDVATATQGAVQGAADATKGAATATGNVVKSAAEATKDAATSIFRLPGVRIVEVHQLCSIAPNGAPDCRTAATNACRTKGFTSGNPMDVRSSQNCPPAVWLSGREPSAGECPEETVVLMAACQ
jgi:type IV secretory pathway TrbL component